MRRAERKPRTRMGWDGVQGEAWRCSVASIESQYCHSGVTCAPLFSDLSDLPLAKIVTSWYWLHSSLAATYFCPALI